VEGVTCIEQKVGGVVLGAIENRQSVKANGAGALACVVAVLVAAVDVVGVHHGYGAVDNLRRGGRGGVDGGADEHAGEKRGG